MSVGRVGQRHDLGERDIRVGVEVAEVSHERLEQALAIGRVHGEGPLGLQMIKQQQAVRRESEAVRRLVTPAGHVRVTEDIRFLGPARLRSDGEHLRS